MKLGDPDTLIVHRNTQVGPEDRQECKPLNVWCKQRVRVGWPLLTYLHL